MDLVENVVRTVYRIYSAILLFGILATNNEDTFPSEKLLRRWSRNQPVRTQERTLKEYERNTIQK